MKAGEVVVLWVLVTVLACSYAAMEAFPKTITGDEEQRFERALEAIGPDLLPWVVLGFVLLMFQWLVPYLILLVLMVEAVRMVQDWLKRRRKAQKECLAIEKGTGGDSA